MEHLETTLWTFAAGPAEGNPTSPNVCPCDASIEIRVPSFVGKDYFCESGVNRPWGGYIEHTLHSNDILWDGEDCLSSSKCCSRCIFCKATIDLNHSSMTLRLGSVWMNSSPMRALQWN